jgi:hypothetical protein
MVSSLNLPGCNRKRSFFECRRSTFFFHDFIDISRKRHWLYCDALPIGRSVDLPVWHMTADLNIEALLALQSDESSSLEETIILFCRGYDYWMGLIGKKW